MQTSMLLIEFGERGVARITLNRAERHNAFDAELIAELTRAFQALADDDQVRVVVMTGAGKSFSAGADVNWMRASAGWGEEQNREDARKLAQMLRLLDEMPKPTVALVNGAALGGGFGLVAACDIALAADRAVFGTTEVRLGIVPAVIGPYVVAAVGARHARRLFLTGQRISAAEAARIGLVHEVLPEAYLEEGGQRVVDELLQGAPGAQGEAKALIRALAGRPRDAAVIEETVHLIARLRAGAEGQEGLSAFLDKRPPAWRPAAD
jgi:methylglutaconyl-CoA hydratase